MNVQTFVPQRSVEGFNEAVIGGLSRMTEVDLNFVVIRPEIEDLLGKLAAVVHEHHRWRPASGDQVITYSDDILATQTMPDFDASASRVKTATIVWIRNLSPFTSQSETKSIEQALFARFGTKRSWRATRIVRCRGRLLRNYSDSAVHSRYAWFLPNFQPSRRSKTCRRR
jgi:hypothetical protein